MSEADKKGTVGQTSDPVQKPHTIDEIVPESTPLIIPYFEVYRTNELEYVEYESPYLNQNETSESTDEEGEGSEEGSGGSGNSRANESKLWTDLANLIWQYYSRLKKKDDFIRDLKSAEVNWTSIAKQVNKRGNPHNGKKQSDFIEQVLRLKEAYSHIDRRSYSNTKKIVIAGGKVINTSPKAQKLIKKMQNASYYDPTSRSYKPDIVTQRAGKLLYGISTISKKEK